MRSTLNILALLIVFIVYGAALADMAANVQGQKPVPMAQAPQGDPSMAQPATGQETAMTDIHDIRPPVDFGVDPQVLTYLLYALAGLLILAGIIALIVYLKRRKRARSMPDVIVPPEQAALEKLRTLKLDDPKDGKLFYFELSSILRGYMEGRFGLDALEMTSEELMPHVMKMDLDSDLKQGVRAFVAASDPVKFAGQPPVREAIDRDVQFVECFVHATMPKADESSEIKRES